jgi:Rrf2 family protein
MISSTAAYALRAATYLANQPDRYVSRAEISDATSVPHEYLLKVLNLLDAAEIVESRRGPGGGYRLRKPGDELSSLEVVSAVDTIPRIKECPLGIVDHEELCPLHRLLDDAARHFEEALAQAKISDLLPKKSSQSCHFPKLSTSR